MVSAVVSPCFCLSLGVQWCLTAVCLSVVHRYVVVATGAAPGVSVGHTCTFLPSSDGGKGRIVVVGGANPNGSFSDSYMINLGNNGVTITMNRVQTESIKASLQRI